jgi:hypothetical protein
MVKRVLLGAGIAAAGWVAVNRVAQWVAEWGIDPDVVGRPLPGDEIVRDPIEVDTRSIIIDAPTGAVWPWLVQMGFGRGGWYSYDRMDMKGRSAEAIVPELQSLAIGDLVPTHPGGGFEVRVLEPERALVLYLDDEIVARQSAANDGPSLVTESPGLAVSGALSSAAMPGRFASSWAFVLEPLPGGRTRLVERFRAALGTATTSSRALGPLMGFGIFVMMRRQMLGIRDRAERPAAPRASFPVADAAAHEAAPAP